MSTQCQIQEFLDWSASQGVHVNIQLDEVKGNNFKRYFMEIFIDILFWTLSTRLSRYIVEKISPKFMGKMFEKMRTIWKRLTKNIKREGLK